MKEVTMSPLAIAIIVFIVGAGGGSGITWGIMRDRGTDAPAVVEQVASVVEEVQRPESTDAEARLAVASAPAVNLAVEAAVKPDASPRTVALAAYLGCLAAAQGKGEGSAAFGCQARGVALDAALTVPGAP